MSYGKALIPGEKIKCLHDVNVEARQKHPTYLFVKQVRKDQFGDLKQLFVNSNLKEKKHTPST